MTDQVRVDDKCAGFDARSKGVLDRKLLSDHVQMDQALAYDPMQIGWIRSDARDDFRRRKGLRAGWPKPVRRASDILLRPWRPEDAPQFRTLLDDPTLWRHMPTPYPGPISTDQASDLIALSNDSAHHQVRAIVVDGQIAGQVRVEFSDQGTEISYWIGRTFWKRGIAGRAVLKFLETAPVKGTLFARVRPGNTASLRLLEKAGFQQQGRSNSDPDWIRLVRPT